MYARYTHIGPEHCRPSIQGMKQVANTRHRQYGSAVYANPTLNIEEVHTEVTDSQIKLITVSLAKITIKSVYIQFNSIQNSLFSTQHIVGATYNNVFCIRRVEKGASRRQSLCGLAPYHNVNIYIKIYTITDWRQ